MKVLLINHFLVVLFSNQRQALIIFFRIVAFQHAVNGIDVLKTVVTCPFNDNKRNMPCKMTRFSIVAVNANYRFFL